MECAHVGEWVFGEQESSAVEVLCLLLEEGTSESKKEKSDREVNQGKSQGLTVSIMNVWNVMCL